MIDNTNRYKQGKSYKPYIYTLQDIAKLCNVEIQTLRNYICKHKIKVNTLDNLMIVYKHFANILILLVIVTISGCYQYQQIRQDNPTRYNQPVTLQDSNSFYKKELNRQELRDNIRDGIHKGLYGY